MVWEDRGWQQGKGAACGEQSRHFESICLGVQVQLSKKRGFWKETVIALGCSGPGAGGCAGGTQGTQASAAIKL